ncbi:TonB-dependent receptor [Rhizorhapis sp. SPR117]|nr:TonB-dependent receptor [Rhizorhapis sp. SPR117]
MLGRQNRMLNIPKGHALGAELDATVIPFRGLQLNASATYVKSEIDGTFDASNALGNPDELGGQAFPLTPQWQMLADGEYSFPVGAGAEAFIGGSFNYQGKTNSGLGELDILRVPAYSVVDARIGVRSNDDSWSVTGFVRNLTDEYYWTFVNFASPDVAARYTGRPRTFGVTLSSRF